VISDLTDGLMAPIGAPMTAAQEDFWTVIADSGGLEGFDVAITADTTVDAHHDPQQHVAGFARIETEIVALAQSMGIAPTRAALPRYDEADMIGAPATWWSGWAFDAFDRGLIVEAGASYCVESMNAFDFVVQETVGDESGEESGQESEDAGFTYAIVASPGDYGGDYAAGVRIAAAAHGMGDPVAEILQIPIWAEGDVTETIDALVDAAPDVVFLATGPGEMAQIVSGAHQGGLTATYVAARRSWDAALLGHEALLPLLEESLLLSSPLGEWAAESEGHAAMRDAAERFGRQPNVGYADGWVLQYNLLALLEQAIAEGDLTRAGIREAAGQLAEIDYGGMLPRGSLVGSPDEIIVRQSLVLRVDSTQPDGLAAATPLFAGPTVSDYTFDAPCYAG
jgi:hypothetical protein